MITYDFTLIESLSIMSYTNIRFVLQLQQISKIEIFLW